MKKIKNIIYTRWFNLLLDGVVRMYSRTLKLEITGEELWQEKIAKGNPVVLCLWHQQFFPFISRVTAYGRFRPAVMISKSRDGDIVASFAFRRGGLAVRGSSSRGGRSALEKLIAHVRGNGLAFHVLDGPTGPMGKVKPGVIKLAKETGAVLFPARVQADKAWFFHSWDRFMLPRPFTRVKIQFGPPVELSADMDTSQFEQDRQFLEDTMQPYLIWPEK